MSKKVNNKRVNRKRVNKNVKGNEENDTAPVVKKQRFSAKSDSDYLHSTQHTLEIYMEVQEYQDRLLIQGYDPAQITILSDALAAGLASAEGYLAKRQLRKSRVNKMQVDFGSLLRRFSSLTTRIRKIYSGDDQLLNLLGLDKKRQETYGGFIDQGNHFYTTALGSEDARVKLEAIGLTAAVLQASFDEITDFKTLWVECQRLKGDCQRMVEARGGDMKRLRRLMGAFIAACRHEFADTPQALETLGIFARNSAPKKNDTEPVSQDPGTNDPGTNDPGTNDPGNGTTEPAVETKTKIA